ncbi:hypothetical protein JCGZ_02843 [Jatropha curcas]|uniref:Uncharacterized protein n=1 Tax=Jatropha curcas TaxID=180498 RepID=A0A067L1T6_JATCU|nr:hypothetical protein JCGZ_02843 [Jatropha curcas]
MISANRRGFCLLGTARVSPADRQTVAAHGGRKIAPRQHFTRLAPFCSKFHGELRLDVHSSSQWPVWPERAPTAAWCRHQWWFHHLSPIVGTEGWEIFRSPRGAIWRSPC